MRVALLMMLALASCSSEAPVIKQSAPERGRVLFADPAASDASNNRFSCAMCHRATRDEAADRILPGAVLAGATARPTYWGGQVVDLLRAVNDCRFYFMAAQRSWTADDEDAKAMYAWISSLPAEAPQAQPFTLQRVAADLPVGDPAVGSGVYDRACRACHGATHTAEGVLRKGIPKLPEESVASFRGYGFDAMQIRVVFIEKVRHGGFLGLFGNMPPYSEEALSDADLAALVAFLGLYQ